MSENNGNGNGHHSFDDNEEEFFRVSDEERRKRREIMDRNSKEEQMRKWAQEDRSDIEKAVQKYAPPVITEPRCHVCTSPHRPWIERQLLDGVSYSAIARMLPPVEGKEFDYRSISSHSKKHMRLEEAVVRAVLEEEADVLGQQWEEGVKGAFTMRGALEVMVRKAYRDAMDGVTTIEPRDIVQMMKLYMEMSTNSGATAIEEAKTSIRIFMLAIQNVCLKSDLVDRDIGQQLLVAISSEVEQLRAEEDIEQTIEKQLTTGGR